MNFATESKKDPNGYQSIYLTECVTKAKTMKIKKLTPEQEALIPIVRDEWIKFCLGGDTSVDKTKITGGIIWAYTKAKLKSPKFIVFAEGPVAAQWIANVFPRVCNFILIKLDSASVRDSVRASVGDSVWDSVWDSVGASVGASVVASVQASVWASVWDSVGASVQASVRDSVWANVRANVRASVRASVGDSVWDSVGASVVANVRASVWDSVGASVRANVQDSVRASVGASVWDSVGASVWDSVWDSVGASVVASVLDSVWDSVGASVWANVRTSVQASVWDSVGDSVQVSVGTSVWDNVRASVQDSVGASVGASVRDSVQDSVRASVGASVRASVGASVQASVWDSVWASVRANVRDSVWASVRDSVGASVQDSVQASVQASVQDSVGASKLVWEGPWIGLGSDAGWNAFYDFFMRIGVIQHENYCKYRDWIKSGAWEFLCFKDLCVVVCRPSKMHKNKRGQLHCSNGPAAQWPSGEVYWFLNGIRVNEKIVLTPEKLTKEEILGEKNVEVRREMLRQIGMERFCVLTKPKVLDKQGDYELLSIDLSDTLKDCRYLSMMNPSINCRHIEGVERECDTVEQAISWRAGALLKKGEVWNPTQLT